MRYHDIYGICEHIYDREHQYNKADQKQTVFKRWIKDDDPTSFGCLP
jgi:hypothetical protein